MSHIIAICMQRHEELIPEFEEISAVAMAVQNMWLYLSSSEKYGGYWSTPKYTLEDEFKAFLNLKEETKCLGLFYVGTIRKGTVLPIAQRSEWQEKVEYHF